MKDKRIAVLMGGLSAEREVSLKSGQAVHAALLRLGYNSIAIDVGQDLAQQLTDHRIEVAFIALHGRYGEDGCVQGLLELMQIPYTGSGVLASGLAMHKLCSKLAFSAAGLTITPYIAVKSGEQVSPEQLPFGLPVVVKPLREGSSIGISRVFREEEWEPATREALRHGREMLVESYVPGRECTVGLLGNAALPVVEIVPEDGYYDYQAKYVRDTTRYIVPAALPEDCAARAQALAQAFFTALGCRGFARADFILGDGGDMVFLEMNSIPGFTPSSLLPKAAHAAGIDFPELCRRIMEMAEV